MDWNRECRIVKKFILASNNNHKIKEIKEILKDFDFEILSLKEAGINIEVKEDGKTFEENSFKKENEIREYIINKEKKKKVKNRK